MVAITPFSFRAFLRDRRVYILVYAAFGLLTAAVVQLDLMLAGATLRFANIVYILVLGFAGLLIFLAFDYRRQAAFFRGIAAAVEGDTPARASVLEAPATLEQQVYADAWQRLYALLSTRLAEEQARTERRVHFIVQWAHHMKTPVSVIDLELQRARKDPAAAGLASYLDSIAEENERLRQALQGLLNAVRLDDFASDFKVEPIDLLQLTRQVVNDYRHAFIAHRVYPRIEEPAEGLPRDRLVVDSDAKWLRLVLEQIISNAIKYSAAAGREGKVVIRFYPEGDTTVLEVADNGIGIPPEDLGRIFEPFFTGTAGRKQAASTGLGLYLVREACARLGHTVSVRSEPGQGTQVRLGFQRDRSLYADFRGSLTPR